LGIGIVIVWIGYYSHHQLGELTSDELAYAASDDSFSLSSSDEMLRQLFKAIRIAFHAVQYQNQLIPCLEKPGCLRQNEMSVGVATLLL
jgi:hypothetical protein